MIVDIFPKFGRVAASEIVISSNYKRAGMNNIFRLRKIAFADVYIVQNI